MTDSAVSSATSAWPKSSRVTEGQIIARLERLPFSVWHARAVAIMGLASFFDAFDALTIAFALPILAAEWHLSPTKIGLLISSGYVGQMLGAIFVTGLAERIGRLRALQLALAIIAILSVACAVSGSYLVLLILRFVQGIGLGAEVPIAATYVNEVCPSRFRGRLVFSLQVTFAAGVMCTSLIALWVIPHLGWQGMFFIGGLPFILALFLKRLLPESPRWLANHNNLNEAHSATLTIEAAVLKNSELNFSGEVVEPEKSVPSSISQLFARGYKRRTITIWIVMFCTSLTGYGLVAWLPSLYRTVYKLPIVDVLQYSILGGVAGFLATILGTFVIDLIGRRWTFGLAFTGSAIPLLILADLQQNAPISLIVSLATLSLFFISILLAGVYAYVPEIYPTSLRALGSGVASSWLRIASILGPTIVGFLLVHATIGSVFLFFATASLVGAIVVWLFLVETKGKTLEELATS